jgi:hypothetical protein
VFKNRVFFILLEPQRYDVTVELIKIRMLWFNDLYTHLNFLGDHIEKIEMFWACRIIGDGEVLAGI